MMRIIDFHTHPYLEITDNICRYSPKGEENFADAVAHMRTAGISKICGSVISMRSENMLENMQYSNDMAFRLQELYPDFYVPGIQINPAYTKESCEAIDRARKVGSRLIGELVPYSMGRWTYSDCDEIFAYAQSAGMLVNCHPTTDEDMRTVLQRFPRLNFVFAHPGEKDAYAAHLARMQDYANMYLDISGTGLFRYGMLRYGIDMLGASRFLFGTDYPICNTGMYIGGVEFEPLTEAEKEAVFHENAERLLGL